MLAWVSMQRLSRFAPLLASLVAPACLIENPNFDVKDSGALATDATIGGASTSGTGGAPTGTDATTSGASGGLGSTGDGATTGATTGTITDATTTANTDTSTDASTGAPQPVSAELRHYPDLAQCDFPYWCVLGGDVHNPSSAENWDVECFDAPFAPPFVVERVGFVVFGRKDGPQAALEFHAYDDGAQAPVKDPFHAVPLGVIDSDGHLDFPLDPPVVVEVQRFCISVRSGAQFGPQLGLALDDVPAPAGQSFVGLQGPQGCDIPPLADITKVASSSKTQWCIDATITTMNP